VLCLKKLFGPLQLYAVPPPDVKFSDAPSHGVLLDAVAIGFAFIVTVVCAVDEQPFALVTTTVYILLPMV